jgi:hypothetical protein
MRLTALARVGSPRCISIPCTGVISQQIRCESSEVWARVSNYTTEESWSNVHRGWDNSLRRDSSTSLLWQKSQEVQVSVSIMTQCSWISPLRQKGPLHTTQIDFLNILTKRDSFCTFNVTYLFSLNQEKVRSQWPQCLPAYCCVHLLLLNYWTDSHPCKSCVSRRRKSTIE